MQAEEDIQNPSFPLAKLVRHAGVACQRHDRQQGNEREDRDQAAEGMGTQLVVEYLSGRLGHRDQQDFMKRRLMSWEKKR